MAAAEAQREFFIDLKVRPYAAKGGLVQPQDDADNELLTGNMHWMREKWRELMVKFYGQEPTQAASPQQPPGMDDVVAEMRQRLKVCPAPSAPSPVLTQLTQLDLGALHEHAQIASL